MICRRTIFTFAKKYVYIDGGARGVSFYIIIVDLQAHKINGF